MDGDERAEEEGRLRAAHLAERLSRAFPTEPIPDRFAPPMGNDEADCDSVFGGRRWDEVEDAEIGGPKGFNCFLYFTPPMQAYYLPAMLRYLLGEWPTRWDGGVYHYLERHLVRAFPHDELFHGMTKEQRRCVSDYLGLVAAGLRSLDFVPDDLPDIERARRFWAGETPVGNDVGSELPESLKQERRDLYAEICEAFAGVVRGGGTSWRETVEMDLYGTDEDRQAARRLDPERPWEDLVDDADWNPDPGVGGWVYLDPAGVRYYLPPAMIRCLREGENFGLEFFLLNRTKGWTEGSELPERFSALTFRQMECVARFVRAMADWEDVFYADDPGLKDGWSGDDAAFWRAVESWT